MRVPEVENILSHLLMSVEVADARCLRTEVVSHVSTGK